MDLKNNGEDCTYEELHNVREDCTYLELENNNESISTARGCPMYKGQWVLCDRGYTMFGFNYKCYADNQGRFFGIITKCERIPSARFEF